jgi:hypothetical protein
MSCQKMQGLTEHSISNLYWEFSKLSILFYSDYGFYSYNKPNITAHNFGKAAKRNTDPTKHKSLYANQFKNVKIPNFKFSSI